METPLMEILYIALRLSSVASWVTGDPLSK